MSDLAGTIRKVTLDGIAFDAMADTNVSETGSQWEVSGVPTSGRNMKKMVRRPETRESIVLACNGAEREVLKELAERIDDFPMSYTTAGNDVYRCTGFIEFETRETEENRATIQLIPRDQWESFVAT
jgi:hypothetical protein